jgi:hypothetical protein
MPTPKTKIAMQYRYEQFTHALERDVRREVQDEVRERIQHIVNYDHDLDTLTTKTVRERYVIMRESLKDFVTFLESSMASAEAAAEREMKS